MPEFFSYSLDPFPCTRTRNQEVQLLTLRRPHLNRRAAVRGGHRLAPLSRCAAAGQTAAAQGSGPRGRGGLQPAGACGGGRRGQCVPRGKRRRPGARAEADTRWRPEAGGRPAALQADPRGGGRPEPSARDPPVRPTARGASGGWGRGARGSGAERTRRLDAGSSMRCLHNTVVINF